MSKNITISNSKLTVTINTFGAELKSIIQDGTEYLWNGDPDVWSGQAPILFPLCGGLKDDKYIFKGKEYTLPKHGFARNSEFIAERTTSDSATFLLTSDESTLKDFPFEFELRITYTLKGNVIDVKNEVTNKGSEDMYFSIGAHEGYACPEGIEEYSIIFEQPENLNASVLDGNLLEYDTVNIAENVTELPLKQEYFEIDALVFLDLKSRKASLKNNQTGKTIDVAFDGFDYLLLWTKPGANYICIEPWCGIPDFVDSDYDITKKTGIIKLEAGKTCVKEHSITF